MTGAPLSRLRTICLSFTETSERLSHGEPAWFVREKRAFVTFSDHHHDDRVAFWCAGAPGAQEVLVQADPARFFRPPYVGHRGWIGVWVDVPIDWEQVQGLVAEAYRMVAPPKLVQALDSAARP